MKKTLFIFIYLLFTVSSSSFAQGISDILNSSKSEILFIGLDFTHCNFVGSEGFTDPKAIVERIIPAWNNLFITEKEKYDLAKTFQKQSFEYDLSYVGEQNAEIDFLHIVSDNEEDAEHLDENQVANIIDRYRIDADQEIGLVFVMESFDKLSAKGNMYVTFFNTRNNQVIFTERMSGKTGGIGVRNFWARSIYNVLLAIQKKQFKAWKKKYGSY